MCLSFGLRDGSQVPERPPADFLWQVNSFQLSGGGLGVIGGAGIDYILPYWMARYYSVISPDAISSKRADKSPLIITRQR